LPPVRGVNIVTRKESGAVKIDVSVFTGNQLYDTAEPVATYIARENEHIVIAELAKFGVGPFEIGVVRKARVIPDPIPVKNDTRSVEVISLEPKDSTLPGYSLTLKNISNKNIVSIELTVYVRDKKHMVCQPRGKEWALLGEAGAVFKADVRGVEVAVKTQQGYVPESPQGQTLVIGTVMFDDGTYEGDARVAAEFRAMLVGNKMQLTRMLTLLRNAIEAQAADPMMAIGNLKRQISSMSFDEDIPVPAELLKNIPDVDLSLESRLKLCIQSGRSYIRQLLLNEIVSFETSLKQTPDRSAFQNWLNATGAKYEEWLSRIH
jgi:hypothetical protein